MSSISRAPEPFQFLRLSSRRCLQRPQRIQCSRSTPRAAAAAAAFSTSPVPRAINSTSSSSSSSPIPTRKHVTVINDDGRIRWGKLSTGEKAARTTQQSFNFLVVIAGVVMTSGVAYLLYTEVFSPSSKTSHFNRATDRLRRDPRITALLGPGPQITAHGEASWSRWARNRYISSTTETDKYGTEHLRFRFYVEGPLNQGVVHVHMTKKPSQSEYEYYTLAVDVKGHQRIYLENAEEKKGGGAAPKIFGAKWW